MYNNTANWMRGDWRYASRRMSERIVGHIAAIWMTTSAMNGKIESVIILLMYAYNNTAKMREGWGYASADDWKDCWTKRHYFIVVRV